MNNYVLNQEPIVDTKEAVNTTTKLQRKSHSSIPEGSILGRLMNFAFSIPDFRRIEKGNHRHKLEDIIILIILARMPEDIGS